MLIEKKIIPYSK